MPLEIVLVRHGESEGNRARVFTGHGDAPLTELGRRQAEATAARILADAALFQARPAAVGSAPATSTLPSLSVACETGSPSLPLVDEILASDLPRAVQTATPLVEKSGVPLVTSAELRERNIGEFTGLSFEEVQRRFPDDWASLRSRDPEYRPGGGESHRMCAERVGRFLDALFARRSDGRVVIYSHGVAINHMLRYLVGLAPDAPLQVYFQVDNCALHRVRRAPGGVHQLLLTNDASHLRDLRSAPEPRGAA